MVLSPLHWIRHQRTIFFSFDLPSDFAKSLGFRYCVAVFASCREFSMFRDGARRREFATASEDIHYTSIDGKQRRTAMGEP
jgi:hypothetical protein